MWMKSVFYYNTVESKHQCVQNLQINNDSSQKS